MSIAAILLPLFVEVALTFGLLFWLGPIRVGALRAGAVATRQVALGQKAWPERAVQIALRTQQVLAYETGVPNSIDPLAGSYYLEALTDEMEAQAEAIFAEIDGMGAIETVAGEIDKALA